MKKPDLHVKIRKKHEVGLRKRFNFSRIKAGREDECPLCMKYLNVIIFLFFNEHSCPQCPFNKYRTDERFGCAVWIKEITGMPCEDFSIRLLTRSVRIPENVTQKKAKDFIQKLKRRAKKLITFY